VTPLTGIEYEDDNGRVFDLLKSWTVNGPAWTWMRSFNTTRNGRRAWLSLINHFEGDAQRDKVKDQAYAAIAAAKYYGEKKRFTFETYVSIHQDAYADVEQYGEIISEEKRERDLLINIKDTSASANAAKGTSLGRVQDVVRNVFFFSKLTSRIQQSKYRPAFIDVVDKTGILLLSAMCFRNTSKCIIL